MSRILLCLVLMFPTKLLAQSANIAAQLASIETIEDKHQQVKKINLLLNRNTLSPLQHVDALLLQSKVYLSLNDFTNANRTSQKANDIAGQALLFLQQAQTNKLQGVIAYYQGNYAQALNYYQKSLIYFQNLSVNQPAEAIPDIAIMQANLLNNIALVQTEQGDALAALSYYQQAEQLYQQFGDLVDIIDVRYNMATLNLNLRRFDLAISMLKEVIHKRRTLHDEYGIAEASAALGVAYKYSGQYQSANQYNLAALQYFKAHNDNYNSASQLHNLAEINYELGSLAQAMHYAQEGIKISEEIGHQKAHVGSLHTLAKIYLYRHDIKQAFDYIQQSEVIAEKMGYQNLLNENLGLKALIAAAQGQMPQALKAHLSYQKTHLKAANDKLNEQLARFESEQLNQQIQHLEQSKKLQTLQDNKAKQQRNFMILCLVFILVVLFTAYRRYLENQLTKNLEVGVKQRTEALEFLTKELQQANKVKSQFLANMSHEIRTPLTAIIGQSEAIIHGDFQHSSLIKEIEIIHNNSRHLLHLINDILDLSKIEADKFELEERQQNLHAVIQEIEDMFTEQATRKHLAFTVTHHLPRPFIINIDGLRLKQILINLCANAIKFTKEGWVTLDIAVVDKMLFFTITDTGIGMDDAQMGKIFQSFTQADNSISRRFSGSGLGLFLSMQLTKVMSGDIHVSSQLGEGSSFVLKLPYEPLSSSTTKLDSYEQVLSEHTAIDQTSPYFIGRIILADDHDDNRRLIARLLTRLGLEVIEAKNGKEALEQCMQLQPSLTLMDIQMPEMDGIQALNKLRKLGYNLPIYALTANAMSHEISEYLALGFNGHLKKPIEREFFIATIALYYPSLKQAGEKLNNAINEVDLSDLKTDFQRSLSQESQLISTYCTQNNLTELGKVAHKLAGAAKMFGYNELSQSALELEIAIKNHQNDKVSDLSGCLLDELNASQAILLADK